MFVAAGNLPTLLSPGGTTCSPGRPGDPGVTKKEKKGGGVLLATHIPSLRDSEGKIYFSDSLLDFGNSEDSIPETTL